MKNVLTPIICLLILFSSFSSAEAAKSKKKKEVESKSTTIAIPNPHLVVVSTPTPAPTTAWIGFGINTYGPQHLNLPSRFTNAPDFSKAGLPGVYFNYSRPVLSHDFNAKVGLNWVGMTRSANLVVSGIPSSQDQRLDLFSLRLGMEYAPERLSGKIFSPYVAASLLPTFTVSGRTVFDDGSTFFGVPIEFALGTRVKLEAIGLPFEGTDFDLAVSETVGSIHGSGVAGLGVNVGVRIEL